MQGEFFFLFFCFLVTDILCFHMCSSSTSLATPLSVNLNKLKLKPQDEQQQNINNFRHYQRLRTRGTPGSTSSPPACRFMNAVCSGGAGGEGAWGRGVEGGGSCSFINTEHNGFPECIMAAVPAQSTGILNIYSQCMYIELPHSPPHPMIQPPTPIRA